LAEKEAVIQIAAKLNPELDADIIIEILKIPKRDRSRTYREALRFYFKHKRKMEEND
jgi:metal-responsive CopG/Arc/MetJ family transcriptional regulator